MRRQLIGLLLVATLALLGDAGASRVAAAERTAVVQLDVTIPVRGVEAVGTLALSYDDATGDGRWEFSGDVAGQPAAASGALAFREGNDGTLAVTIRSIDRWEVATGAPTLPATLTLRGADGSVLIGYDGPTVDVFAIPFDLSPALAIPLEGTWALADAGASATGGELPATGAAPSGDAGERVRAGTLLVGAGLLLVALGLAALVMRSRRSAVPHG